MRFVISVATLMQKLIVILGPTASGKTEVSIKLAKKYGGQIISADSRQVYKGLDIGSGKVTKKEMLGIGHYLLDVANPKRKFTVSHYQKLTQQAIKKIHANHNIPFLVGGTGFYIQSIVDGRVFPESAPNWKLRKKLEKKSAEQLFLMLKKLDPQRAKTIEIKNPRRLIRAIEINLQTGQPVPKVDRRRASINFDILQIGIKKDSAELKKLIQKRLQKRMAGIIIEVKKLHKHGLSYKRLEELGLEYRFVAQYIQGKLTLQQAIDSIQIESEHFAKRQMTWFKRDKKIHWVKNYKEADKLIQNFL
jgi:tRNA dimethylallyltransferase